MLEKLLTTPQMVKYLQSQFEGEILDLNDTKYNSKTDFQIHNPYSDKKIIISCQARKGQQSETIEDFKKKLMYANNSNHILIPIFLTGKAGKKYTNDFVFPYKSHRGAVRNANPFANIHNLYSVSPKVFQATDKQNGNLFVLIQKEKFNFNNLLTNQESTFFLKHFETKQVEYLPRKFPSNFNQLPISEQSQLLNDHLYQKKISRTGLHFTKDPRSFNDIKFGIYNHIIKSKL